MKYILLLGLVLIGCNKEVIHPTTGPIVEAVYGLGTVESEEIYQAKAAVVTYVDEFYVKEGQDVVKGQKLFKTDEGVITKAPFAGRVTDIPVSVHQNIFQQTVILSLVNLEKIFLSVSLEQQAVMRIKKGVKAEISFEFFRNQKLNGIIETIYPHQSEFIAKVKVEQWPKTILPGMTADVAFQVDQKENATLVPAKAIVNGNLIYKHNGKKIKSIVKVGLMDNEFAEVLEPKLENSDEIIIP